MVKGCFPLTTDFIDMYELKMERQIIVNLTYDTGTCYMIYAMSHMLNVLLSKSHCRQYYLRMYVFLKQEYIKESYCNIFVVIRKKLYVGDASYDFSKTLNYNTTASVII